MILIITYTGQPATDLGYSPELIPAIWRSGLKIGLI